MSESLYKEYEKAIFQTPLDFQKIVKLVNDGLDINAINIDGRGTNNTALALATMHGHIAAVEFLISKGADINTQNYKGITALHYAASFGHEDVVELLLKKGADISLFDNQGATAYQRGLSSGKTSDCSVNCAKLIEVKMKEIEALSSEGRYGAVESVFRGSR